MANIEPGPHLIRCWTWPSPLYLSWGWYLIARLQNTTFKMCIFYLLLSCIASYCLHEGWEWVIGCNLPITFLFIKRKAAVREWHEFVGYVRNNESKCSSDLIILCFWNSWTFMSSLYFLCSDIPEYPGPPIEHTHIHARPAVIAGSSRENSDFLQHSKETISVCVSVVHPPSACPPSEG